MNKVRFGVMDMRNNKMCDLQRRACGYRDENYLTLKIVAAFLLRERAMKEKTHCDPRRSPFFSYLRGPVSNAAAQSRLKAGAERTL